MDSTLSVEAQEFYKHQEFMHTIYKEIINNTLPQQLYTLPHKQIGAHPTGFVVVHLEPLELDFPFTVCPVVLSSHTEANLPGINPHDVIILYKKEYGSLETVLYTLYERYKETNCVKTEYSTKRFLLSDKLPPRKIIIPSFKRKENLIPVLKRFQMIDLPKEGYLPQILLVEHSPIPELQQIAENFECEYIWFPLKLEDPFLPLGQFNKALCYDKAFLYGTPAEWYLFHDNDILVPKTFWNLIDENIQILAMTMLNPANSAFGLLKQIEKIVKSSKRDMIENFSNQKMNLTVRNFPDTVENIRKKWKIKDGGNQYCFFTTDKNENKIALICTKI